MGGSAWTLWDFISSPWASPLTCASCFLKSIISTGFLSARKAEDTVEYGFYWDSGNLHGPRCAVWSHWMLILIMSVPWEVQNHGLERRNAGHAQDIRSGVWYQPVTGSEDNPIPPLQQVLAGITSNYSQHSLTTSLGGETVIATSSSQMFHKTALSPL